MDRGRHSARHPVARVGGQRVHLVTCCRKWSAQNWPLYQTTPSPNTMMVAIRTNLILACAEACLALAHKTKELDTRAALLAFAYEFRTVAKRLQRDERKFSDGVQK